MPEPVVVDRVTKRFAGHTAVDTLSLSVPAGIIYGLLGPNGAGKTTLIRVLATLLPFEAGVARVAGVDVERDPAAVRAGIGLAGQYAAVDDHLTGRENVEMVGLLYGLTRREVRRRTSEWLLSPVDPWERVGDVGNVVFPCGAICHDDGKIDFGRHLAAKT